MCIVRTQIFPLTVFSTERNQNLLDSVFKSKISLDNFIVMKLQDSFTGKYIFKKSLKGHRGQLKEKYSS